MRNETLWPRLAAETLLPPAEPLEVIMARDTIPAPHCPEDEHHDTIPAPPPVDWQATTTEDLRATIRNYPGTSSAAEAQVEWTRRMGAPLEPRWA
jgi:hypothetical protein